jgi:anaerobic selenocysteine-containing dehydrogenase
MQLKDQGEKVTRTVCMMPCGEMCGVLAHVKNGVLTKVEPADFPEPKYFYVCRKGLSTPKIVYHPDRLKYPMKRAGERGEGKWQRISWDEALDTIAGKLKDIAAKYNPESVAMISGGLNVPHGGLFIGQRFASAIGASWVSPQGAAMAAQICADMTSTGSRFGEPYHLNHEDPRLCVYWGSNVVETFPWRYRNQIRPAREKGAKMVCISPIFTPTAAKSDEWLPIRPGTDAALALGMINIIVSEGLCDEAFIIEHTVGPFLVRSDNGLFLREEHDPSGEKAKTYLVWDTKTNKPQTYDTPGVTPALRGSYTVDGLECKPAFQLLVELAEQYSLEKVSKITEIAPDAIRKLAVDYATRRPVVSERGIGMSRNYHGNLGHRAITALAAVTGNICLKRPQDFFANLNWRPFLFPGGRFYKPLTSFQFYNSHLTGKPYPIKAFWVSSHNPANSHPNRNNMQQLLSNMEFIVVSELFMSTTAEYADIVLPGSTTFECTSMALPWETFFGGIPYLQIQPKVIEPYYECKSDLEIYTELAQRMGLGEFFDKSADEYIEMLLSSGHPSLQGITLDKLREGPLKPNPDSAPRLFTTPSGRLEFYAEKMKEFGQELPVFIEPLESARQPLAQKYPLIFMTMHTKFRHHSKLAEVDWLRELDPEPLVDMNPVDAKKRGIKDGDMVVIFNDRGRAKLKARFHEGMRPGMVTIGEGWQPRHFAEGSYQELTGTITNPAQEAVVGSVGQMQGVLVEVRKASEG